MSRRRREGEGARVERKLDRIERRIDHLSGYEAPNDWQRAEPAALEWAVDLIDALPRSLVIETSRQLRDQP